MDGVWYLLAVVGVWMVAWWCWRNDRSKLDGSTTGLLAMTAEQAATSPPAPPGKPGRGPRGFAKGHGSRPGLR